VSTVTGDAGYYFLALDADDEVVIESRSPESLGRCAYSPARRW